MKIPKQIDLPITLIPFACVSALCVIFALLPEASAAVLHHIRDFLNRRFSLYYLALGLGMFLLSLYIAFSKYGKIRLGNTDKPQFSYFKWGSMLFTAGLAADIIFYSLCEWILYSNEPRIQNLAAVEVNPALAAAEWSAAYPLFHWGFIPWSFYMVLAACFGFMIHNRNIHRQRYSEACRPLLGKRVDGAAGRFIDMLAIFALIAGTASTFSLATPLLSMALGSVFSISGGRVLSIAILLVTCLIYSIYAYLGIESVAKLASYCTYLFFALLLYVFVLGGQGVFIVRYSLLSLQKMLLHFFPMASYMSPPSDGFTQNWTVFYWAYWIVWCVATPFFIGSISKGRTIRQTILGAYAFGLSGTYVSFMVLGNYGLGLQLADILPLSQLYRDGTNIYSLIVSILNTLPHAKFVLLLLALTMIAFYATTFDTLTLIAAAYSYKELAPTSEPGKKVKLFWSVLLILLPIALLFSENSMSNLQTLSIIAAFPIGMIIILIVCSFFKDAAAYLKENRM